MTDPRSLCPHLRAFAAGLLLGLALILSTSGTARAETATVFAAASLKTALDRVAEGFEAATGHEVVLSYAGSSALARQIGFGAPADLFVSANAAWMDEVQADGRIDAESRVDLLGNRLALVGHAAPPDEAQENAQGAVPDIAAALGPDGRLAMALVEAVPAGIYGRAALTALGQWPALAPRVAQTDNVRAALALVAAGEAPLGVVYVTDARAEPRVHLWAVFPEDSHPPIVYPAARIAGRKNPAADAFLAWLQGPQARAIFAEEGFAPLTGGAR